MNRQWCYFDKDERCIFPVACPRDSVCRKQQRPMPVPNEQFSESYNPDVDCWFWDVVKGKCHFEPLVPITSPCKDCPYE